MDGNIFIGVGLVFILTSVLLLLIQLTYWRPFTRLEEKFLLAIHKKLTSHLHSKVGPMLVSQEQAWRHPMSQALRVVYYREKFHGRIPRYHAAEFWELHTAIHRLEVKLANDRLLKP